MDETREPAPVERIVERIREAAAPYAFRTFLIGLRLPRDWSQDRREGFGRPIKRAVGAALEETLWPDRSVSFTGPEVQILVDPWTAEVHVRSAPIFVAGRYRKYVRDISSAEWHHRACRGRGCAGCDFRGTVFRSSVERVVSGPVREAARGEAAFFHSMGREDVDVRMLGSGRPFVVEVRAPRRRALDLAWIEGEIARRGAGEVDAMGLAMVDRAAVAPLKAAAAEKAYDAICEAEGPLPPDLEARVAALSGQVIDQRTPRRVSHRRADRVRRRRVPSSRAQRTDARHFRWFVRAASGTYIKELASGDEGRTRPSLAELLGVPCAVVSLDVVEIDWRGPWEAGARCGPAGSGR